MQNDYESSPYYPRDVHNVETALLYVADMRKEAEGLPPARRAEIFLHCDELERDLSTKH